MRERNSKKKDTCSKCNNLKEESRVNQRYCLSCHNEYMRNTRPKHSELSPLQRLKANCRSYLNVYLRRGKITKKPCEVCGDLNVEAHHDDYNKPLEVKWLCRKHHMDLHITNNNNFV